MLAAGLLLYKHSWKQRWVLRASNPPLLTRINALLILKSFSPGKEVFNRTKNIYIYHLSSYKIPADSRNKVKLHFLCPITQKIDGQGAHCSTLIQGQLTPRPQSLQVQCPIFVLGKPPQRMTLGCLRGALEVNRQEFVKDPQGPFIWLLQLPAIS